jgi:hypothetical protein
MGFRQETALDIMAEMCRQAGYANSTELNNALNECLKIMITTSDDFKAGRADAYELISKMRMYKLTSDKIFRGVP